MGWGGESDRAFYSVNIFGVEVLAAGMLIETYEELAFVSLIDA
jgi:hypothetical protein